jgi:hypothetical protein
MSVIIKTTGHKRTPAVRLKERLKLKILIFTGERLKVSSREKILTPINSARSAFAIKKDPRI